LELPPAGLAPPSEDREPEPLAALVFPAAGLGQRLPLVCHPPELAADFLQDFLGRLV